MVAERALPHFTTTGSRRRREEWVAQQKTPRCGVFCKRCPRTRSNEAKLRLARSATMCKDWAMFAQTKTPRCCVFLQALSPKQGEMKPSYALRAFRLCDGTGLGSYKLKRHSAAFLRSRNRQIKEHKEGAGDRRKNACTDKIYTPKKQRSHEIFIATLRFFQSAWRILFR